MKINEVIRQRRKELGLTQDRVAELLGVSAPAVNKWENGNSYPDITLLPPLARLLKTDLNTLLSFQDELTDLEVANELYANSDFNLSLRFSFSRLFRSPDTNRLRSFNQRISDS